MGDQLSHIYKTRGKIAVLYILIFMLLGSRLEDKFSELNGIKHSPDLICFYFPHELNFYLLLSFADI
jgi:hypothetical protein